MVKTFPVNEKYHERLKKVADLLGNKLTNSLEEAIDLLYNKTFYSNEQLMNFFLKYPKLKIHKDMLEHEFEGAPETVRKNIILLEKKCNENMMLDVLLGFPKKEKLKELMERNLEGVSIVIKTNEEDKEKAMEKLFEFTKMIEEINEENQKEGYKLKEIEVSIMLAKTKEKLENQYKLLIFSCYKNKKENGDKNEEK